MKFEFSAGGVVLKKTNGAYQVLLAQHSQHHGWVFPKGLIGDHPSTDFHSDDASSERAGQARKENKEETAVREVAEETGAQAKILQPLKPVTYWYVFDKEKIKKTVYYFVMEYTGGDITKHDHEMENVIWFEPKDVLDKLTYKSDKIVWQEAKPVIEKLI